MRPARTPPASSSAATPGHAPHRPRWLATTAAIVAVAVGYVLLAGALLVRDQLLDERLYHDALARAGAYDRVYTSILVDPEIVDSTERLLGDLRHERVDPADARVLATNVLRWVVPPSLLRSGTEQLISSTLAYVRGDVERIEARVDLDRVLDRVEEATATYSLAALGASTEQVHDTMAEYTAEIGELEASIRMGRIPAAIPLPSPDLDGSAVAEVLDRVARELGADRATVAALTAAGADRDALATAVVEAVTPRALDARFHIEERLEDGRVFDAVRRLAERTDRSQERVVSGLDTVRDLVATFGPLALWSGTVLVLGGAAAIVVLHRADARRAVLLLGVGALAASAAVALTWLGIRFLVRPPLGAAISTSATTAELPLSIRELVADLEANLASTLTRAATRLVVVPAAAGAVAVASAWSLARRPRHGERFAVAAAGGAALVAAAAWVAAPVPDPAETCNGHVELCDRRYDEIVQAATHNSMSSPEVVKVWPEHDETIPQQLEMGIRTLLIDTHYWTEVVSDEQLARLDPAIPRSVIDEVLARQDAALAARPGTYLCHNHCVWGGVPLVDVLGDVRDFLDENPREVVTLVVQDAISVADTEAAFEAAGLLPLLYAHDPGAAWPTLGEMIERGDRLVVFAEESGTPPDWYHAAFEEHIQDTPFRFATVDDLSCERLRGPPDAPLFMMNHWLSGVAPDRRNAAIANQREVVVERARRCEAERGQLPDFVAVDFAGIGDVLGAVDELNGLTPRS